MGIHWESFERTAPLSPAIKITRDKISLLHIKLRDIINADIKGREKKAVETIRENPRYFYSYIQITQDDIVKAINEIDTYAATSDGDIPARILKECKNSLSVPLKMLWDWSFSTGIIPTSLKEQYITPVHKGGNKTKAARYRPISLTSHVMKIAERKVRDLLVLHLEENELIDSSQHGFRKGRSCLTQLLHHYDQILRNLNEGYETDVIYLDYAKAFDKVDHDLLMQKLEIYGVEGRLLRWIQDFLTGRMQTVVVDGHKSVSKPVTSGVPQGSVLAPILFIIYTNDMHQVVENCGLGSFADDTKVLCKIEKVQDMDLVRKDLNNIIKYSTKNNMVPHEDKFVYLRYKTSGASLVDDLPFMADQTTYTTPAGHALNPSLHTRDLGVHMSTDYTWDHHIAEMTITARNAASWALGIFSDRSPEVLLPLYKSMVRSHTEYCSPLWNPLDVHNIQKIEDIQRYFTRWINGLQDKNYWERLRILKIPSLQRRRERYQIIHVWKILNLKVPNDIEMTFSETERRGIRVKIPTLNKKAPQSVNTLYDASFAVHAGRIWNTIPADVTRLKNLETFKVHLGKYLDGIPDQPPTRGYTSQNRNSVLDWAQSQNGGLQLARWPY